MRSLNRVRSQAINPNNVAASIQAGVTPSITPNPAATTTANNATEAAHPTFLMVAINHNAPNNRYQSETVENPAVRYPHANAAALNRM